MSLMIKLVDSELASMAAWITERESIRAKKEAGLPKPWTTDPFLRDFRWCNVRRMDDRVSRELLAAWYAPSVSSETTLIAAVLGRLINWTSSLLEITDGGPFELRHLDRARAVLTARAERGEKDFTGAYIVPGIPGKTKVDSVCDLAALVSVEASNVLTSSMRGTWANLTKFQGLGSFLAGQVVADMAHLPVGRSWADSRTWAPIGPGSARGMNRLMGRPKDRPLHQAEFEILLPELMSILKELVPTIWEDRKLLAMDIQNVACEYDKSRRLQLGEGSVRSRYDGKAVTHAVSLWD